MKRFMFTNTNNNIFKMSKRIIITLSICLAIALSSNAQNQLTYNQVLLVNLTIQGDTVPQGKVWEVESHVSNVSHTADTYFRVNNDISDITKNWLENHSGYMLNRLVNNQIFPMWLQAGTIITEGTGVSAHSIIEFNIE